MLSMQAPISGLGAAIPGAAALVPRVPCLPAPLQLSTLAAARLEGRPGPLLESERGLEPRARVRRDHDHRSIWSVTPPLIQPAACTFHGALRCGVQAARRTRSPSVSPPRVYRRRTFLRTLLVRRARAWQTSPSAYKRLLVWAVIIVKLVKLSVKRVKIFVRHRRQGLNFLLVLHSNSPSLHVPSS